jgi:aldose 1-epimerase
LVTLRSADFDRVRLFTLRNQAGTRASFSNYGATLVSLWVADRRGRFADVVLGHRSLEGYLNGPQRPYFGATIGRVANRIAGARFRLGGKDHRLSANEGPHHLHGGHHGFDKVVWEAEPFSHRGLAGLRLRYESPDGEEGYPGTLRVEVRYTLSEDQVLGFEAEAVTDRATPVNLTNHSYFNLAGEGSATVLGHQLWIDADHYLPLGAGGLPQGRLASVAGGPFDFRHFKALGRDLGARDAQLRRGGGYDHHFVLNRKMANGWALAARLYEPASGRFLELQTQEPGLQLYGGQQLDGRILGKSGRPYLPQSGLCLETQHCPDSVHHRAFPSIILRPGRIYHSRTRWRFSTR